MMNPSRLQQGSCVLSRRHERGLCVRVGLTQSFGQLAVASDPSGARSVSGTQLKNFEGSGDGRALAPDLEEVLEAEGIQRFEEDIRLMSGAKLKELFGAKTTGRINLSLLIKNMIWQVYERIQAGEQEVFEGNIRSFWYSHVKPVLSRAGGLRSGSDPYGVMIDVFVHLVLELDLLRYREFGFFDEREGDRLIGGANGHILVAAEKRGHFPFLKRLHDDFDVTVISLGGQPSLLSTEYFAGEMEAAGFELGSRFPLLCIVDFDPSGWLIVDSFLAQLEDLGFGQAEVDFLVLPEFMGKEQIQLNKYRLSRKKSEKTKNEKWVAKSGGVDGKLYGLEADAMGANQLRGLFRSKVDEYLKLGMEEVRRRRQQRKLIQVLERKILEILS